jgi:O-succinylbenzoate synthase
MSVQNRDVPRADAPVPPSFRQVTSGARIEAVEVLRITLPLAQAFHTTRGIDRVRRLCVVRVVTSDGEGWGECAALNEPGYTAEWADGAAAVVERELAPALLLGALPAATEHPMATAAVRLALLDAELRAAGVSLASHLGATATRVPSGIALGLDADLDEIDRAVEAGYHRVKLKIEPGHDVELVRATRDRWPELPLQVDANGSYRLSDAAHLAALGTLDELGLLLIEQPLLTDDLDGHAALAARLRTPVCLDESITSLSAADDALTRRACSVICIKPGRLGGIDEAVRVHDRCRATGVPVWCGGMVESGLGRAANLALAALPGFTLPGDLTPSRRWFADDLTEPVELDADGYLPVPSGPGLGVSPRPEALARFAESRVTVRP